MRVCWARWLVACGLVVAGCGGTQLGPAISAAELTGGARCRLSSTQTGLLITEWPAAEKANLEAMLSGGAVAVEFTGCAIRLLPECRLPGRYTWQRTTPSTDMIEITNEADLYAKFPLGVATLSGELQRSGGLYVQTTVAGQKRLTDFSASQVASDAACARATHLIGALSLGAFTLSANDQQSARADVAVSAVEAGGGVTHSTKVLRSAGSAEACAVMEGEGAPANCASPIQIFLSAIPGRAPEEGAAGTIKVDFVSTSEDLRWDVYVDDEATCTTPCVTWVDPARPVSLRTREDLPDSLQIQSLDPGGGAVQVAAQPQDTAMFSAGVVFTTFSGIAIVTGLALTAVGCAVDGAPGGLCTAGLITSVLGGGGLTGSILMIVESKPHAHVHPLYGNGATAGLTLTPTGLRYAF